MKFYKTILVEVEDIMKEVYPKGGVTLDERLPNGECEDCSGTEWVLNPKEMGSLYGWKPYITCMNCGFMTHL